MNVSDRYLRKLCQENKIPNAEKNGKVWMIPKTFLMEQLPKISIVLGGAYGEGLEFTKYLAELGHNVVVIDKSQYNIDNAKSNLSSNLLKNCTFFCADTSDSKAMGEIRDIYANYNIDILIMNAGTPIIDKVENNNRERIDVVFKGYVYGNIICMATFYPLMHDTVVVPILQKKASTIGLPNETIYNAAMHGLNGFMDCIKLATESEPIYVLKIFSGSINTKFWDEEALFMPIKKPQRLIPPRELAEIVINTAKANKKYNVSELHIERTKS